MKLGLKNPARLNKALGSPIDNFSSIHIAGTNGKGSVATKIANALRLAGYRVGLFTSPHIHTFHERIQINGENIPDEKAERILKKIQETKVPATYFEEMTLMAFTYFADERVDWAVIEVGLGGRLDATNIIKPKLSVITSISFDHTEILGNTLEKIAWEKGGIIKPNTPVVIGPTVPYETISSIVKGAPLYQVKGDFSFYDQENTAVAKKALEALNFPTEGIDARPPCRLQIEGDVVFDVCHNPSGFEKTFSALKKLFPDRKFCALCAFSPSKDIEGCLKVLKNYTNDLILSEAELTAKISDVFPIAEKLGFNILKETKDLLIVCGSFYHLSAVRKKLFQLS